MLKVFIGWDSREDIAYQVAKQSILNQTKTAVDIIPVRQKDLRDAGIYLRDHDELASTEFSLTRFLVPYMCNYSGWALFVDCDILLLEDLQQLFDLADDKYALMCVKHNYTPKQTTKMDGKKQHLYPRKNWSSVMLFNCGHPSNKKLSSGVVNSETPQYLHRMSWLHDDEIGDLPLAWNYLVGWYNEKDDVAPKLLHYTEGGPWFSEYKNCEYSEEWYDIYHSIN